MAEPDGLKVEKGERDRLRVFDLTAAPELARTLDSPEELQKLVGAASFDASQADLFKVSDLGEMTLSDYLAEAHDIPPEQLDKRRGRLDALSDHVLVVRSRAFGGAAMTLIPSPELHLVAVFEERPTDWSGGPLEADSARPQSAPPSPPRAERARARRIGGGIFALFMLLLAVILWLILA